ncbi:MAG: radical SAM family heme chaperone HemW [Holosporales bacterium]|nr:radical SAM family heme chaperone HemW [Holosporales bacterium]
MSSVSTVYIHWPYCISKCRYCDFYSIPCARDIDHTRWLTQYKAVLSRMYTLYHNDKITSIYFGGGTPSLLPTWFVGEIVDHVHQLFEHTANAEITLEANPLTISAHEARVLKSYGVNRISIGVQSLIDMDLTMLGRTHNSAQAIRCVREMSEIFENISIDMIYNRPHQTTTEWAAELDEALNLPIMHTSLYELIVEEKTELGELIRTGELSPPSDSPEFFERTIEVAAKNGFEMYEVSSFAKHEQYHCHHNQSYWKYEDYYGVGPGAHSRLTKGGNKVAIAQVANIDEWLLWSEDPHFNEEMLSNEDEYKERLIMGLRARTGIDLHAIDERISTRYGLKNKLEKLLKNDYAVSDGECVILTQTGVSRLNLIVRYLTNRVAHESSNQQ